mmetsp:Transcript_22300/g.67019  ORF Transcript_22300/g.67019 Transcript_22300/m.67019 type:complete len:303 (+) Transcript_22300:1995-2903(+)
MIPLARAAVAAAPGVVDDRPSVSTTKIFADPGRAPLKTLVWTNVMACAVYVPPAWYRIALTAEVTAVIDVPAEREMATCCVAMLLYCTTETLVSVGPDPSRKLRTTEFTKDFDVAKLLAPTLPEPSTKKTSSTGADAAHVGDCTGALVTTTLVGATVNPGGFLRYTSYPPPQLLRLTFVPHSPSPSQSWPTATWLHGGIDAKLPVGGHCDAGTGVYLPLEHGYAVRVGKRVGLRVGSRVGDRVGGRVGARVTGALAAEHTVVAIELTMFVRPENDDTVVTRLLDPAIAVSCDVLTPEPTPTA